MGITPRPGYAFLFLAKFKGFFEQERVSVALVEYSSLGDVRRAFERGQIDNSAPPAAMLNRGPTVVVAGT